LYIAIFRIFAAQRNCQNVPVFWLDYIILHYWHWVCWKFFCSLHQKRHVSRCRTEPIFVQCFDTVGWFIWLV